MNWSFSLKMMPGEVIVEQSEDRTTLGIKSVHTPILTNQRVMFKFNSLSSGLIQSFMYNEIEDARPATRLLIDYLRLTAGGKEYYLNVDVPEEWALKIIGYKEMLESGQGVPGAGGATPSRSELAVMLGTLQKAGILTAEEYREKLARLKG